VYNSAEVFSIGDWIVQLIVGGIIETLPKLDPGVHLLTLSPDSIAHVGRLID